MDQVNAADPRVDEVDGQRVPRELAFARRTYDWVKRLLPTASEALLLATRGHTLRRWEIPRDRYPRTSEGYHAWRKALADFHAECAEEILRAEGYPQDMMERVAGLIRRENWQVDAEGQALEDADCLAFLETKLSRFLEEWDEDKLFRVLQGTLGKMSPAARAWIPRLSMGPEAKKALVNLGML